MSGTELVNANLAKAEENISPTSPSKKVSSFVNTKCTAIDIEWNDLSVSTTVKKKGIENGKRVTKVEEKVILNSINGTIRHGKFTAVMGPSGCGKTTLLNVLSGRTEARLKIEGELKINSHQATGIDHIGNLVAFVQQDDILLPTITPREVFNFTASLRLNLSKAEKKQRVEALIKDLGLTRCADTKVGNNLIRGLSGGERKRASIGVELITNPSLIFLDEPTTGLDSTTALNVLELLKSLADHGRNVVSTIHQPSSEIFNQFDYLLLMVRGNVIYQGDAKTSVAYFGNIGYPCPKLTNPADFFMKLMNESGMILDEIEKNKDANAVLNIDEEEIDRKFQKRVDDLVRGYNSSGMDQLARKDMLTEKIENKQHYQVSWFKQFHLIFFRSLINEIRNPLDVKSKFGQVIFFALVVIALYTPLTDDFVGIQDRIGVLFLGAMSSGMASITGSLGTFSLERPVFIRERKSKSYSASAYFWGRAVAELPILVCFPVLFSVMTYFAIKLNLVHAGKFFIFLAFHILGWFAGSGYGLLLSTVFPTLELALALVPVLVIPFMVLAGFFVNQNSIPKWLYEFEYLSVFKWILQGVALNEFHDLKLTCEPVCNPFTTLNIKDPMYASFIALAGIGIMFRIFAFWGLVKISTPKTAKFQPRGANANNNKNLPAIQQPNREIPKEEVK